MPNRVSARAKEHSTPRRAEIIRVAGRLFAERGFEATSFRDLGEAVGIRRGSFYAHFEAKEEIMLELLLPPLERTLEVLERYVDAEGTGAERLAQCVEDAFRCSLESRDSSLVLLQDRHLIERTESLRAVSETTGKITRVWLQIASEGQADGSMRGDIAPALVVRAIYSLLFGVLSDRHVGLQSATGTTNPDPDDLSRLLRAALFEGLQGGA